MFNLFKKNKNNSVSFDGKVNLVPIKDRKIVEALKAHSDKIQPDLTRERDLKGIDEKGAALYDSMTALYKELCKENVCFTLCFLTPTEYKPLMFFRMAESIEDGKKYQHSAYNLQVGMYNLLWWFGFIKHKQEIGELIITEKGKHLTCLEEMKQKGVV